MSDHTALGPLDTLLGTRRGRSVPLTPRLERLYGGLRMAQPRPGVARVLSNFVTTLDGVVSLQVKGHDGGGDISGFNADDRMVMGLLRAVADAVVLGGGSLDADPNRLWTAESICPELTADYRRLRAGLGRAKTALRVVVSASGRLNLDAPAFTGPGGPLLIVTSRAGAKRLSRQKPPDGVEIRAADGRGGMIAAGDILSEISRLESPERVLVEGGPRLLASFYTDKLIDEQFLTLSPQLSGREADDGRFSLVMGTLFAPERPRWGTLIDVRRSRSHLFLRYVFDDEGRGVKARPARRGARSAGRTGPSVPLRPR